MARATVVAVLEDVVVAQRITARDAKPAVSELTLGPGLPTLRIGSGPRPLFYSPGLTIHPGIPTGMERRMTTSGWEPLLGDYTIYRVGRRVRPVGTTFAEMAEDACAAIEELGAPVDVMGASTGGMLAIHVAATRPDLVRRLVLVITGHILSEYGRRMGETVVTAARAGKWRTVAGSIMPIGASSRLGRSAFRIIGSTLGPLVVGIPRDPTLMIAELDAWLRVDAEPLLPRITSSTLILAGERDLEFPPAITEAMARGLPTAELVVLPGVAHAFPGRLMSDHIAPFLLTPDSVGPTAASTRSSPH
jgi:pimeloyl-[acyl-carrier protein] methyl ester esterase